MKITTTSFGLDTIVNINGRDFIAHTTDTNKAIVQAIAHFIG